MNVATIQAYLFLFIRVLNHNPSSLLSLHWTGICRPTITVSSNLHKVHHILWMKKKFKMQSMGKFLRRWLMKKLFYLILLDWRCFRKLRNLNIDIMTQQNIQMNFSFSSQWKTYSFSIYIIITFFVKGILARKTNIK